MNVNKQLMLQGLKNIIVSYGYRGSIPDVSMISGINGGKELISDCIDLLFEDNLSKEIFIDNFDSGDFTSFLQACQKLGIDCKNDERLYRTIKQKSEGLEKEILM